MFGKLKKFLVLVPCMILGLFLCSEVEVSAASTKVATVEVDDKVYAGTEDTSENLYYFTNSGSITIKISNYQTGWAEGSDRALKYRVLNPNGTVTDWSDYYEYVSKSGKLIINLDELTYREAKDDSERYSLRNVAAPKATYIIDIKYYGNPTSFVKWFYSEQKAGSTLKVVYNKPTDMITPNLSFTYNSASQEYKIKATTENTSIITGIKLFYSNENLELGSFGAIGEEFRKENFVEGSVVNFSVPQSEGEEKYLYVAVETGNKRWSYIKIDNQTKGSTVVPGDDLPPVVNDNADDTGLFDYDFGELILLALVIVLIVSCTLIIVQKIVDCRKKLY